MHFDCRLSAALLMVLVSTAYAEQDNRSASFGGPNSVPNLIESTEVDAQQGWGTSLGDRWDAWKKALQQDHGIVFGMDYTGVYFKADDDRGPGFAGIPSDTAAAGNLRLYGTWDLTGRGTGDEGTLVWKVESRHNYGSEPAPARTWAFSDLGYAGLVGPPFNDDGLRIQNFYWRQRFDGGRYSLAAGTIDVTDFLDLYGMVSPWLHFSNFAFSTGSATIDTPDDGGFGIGFGALLTDNIYFMGSWQDANGDTKEPWESVDNFFSDNEYFASAELGWTKGKDNIYVDNYHMTVWHKDARDAAGKPSGWGVNFSFSRFVSERWAPFLRGGWSDDGDSILQKSLSAGIGYRLRGNRDLIGFGLNWGEPNEGQAVGTDSQYATELFYRLQVGKRLQLTADIQYIKDPAASTENSIWVAGARGRIAF